MLRLQYLFMKLKRKVELLNFFSGKQKKRIHYWLRLWFWLLAEHEKERVNLKL